MRFACLAFLVAACTTTTPGGTASSSSGSAQGVMDAGETQEIPDAAILVEDAGIPDAAIDDAGPTIVDRDMDGLDDGQEALWAEEYFPFYSLANDDACPTHGVLFRITPHPTSPGLMMAWFDVLFDEDCGLTRHEGDNECMGVVFHPEQRAPDGILAVRTISHQGTACQSITTCGSCNGLEACATSTRNGLTYPVAFASKNKHGGYVKERTCDLNVVCDLGGCDLNAMPSSPPMVNAGEPDHPLVRNLTTEGFITEANGWDSPSVMNYDPWGGQDFGSAGNVADDLVDLAFVVEGCAAP